VPEEQWTGRGVPWEYDPGPPRNRRWPRLFAETPNYRALGLALTGREAFRWHFGPMFYRGRLGDGQVKVLIVGQEGAQDESLAHRSFTGGTGARMQYVLLHLGITRSYLFLNTFVYPIFGQYGSSLRALAQDLRSPVCQHRNEIFDYAAARNDLHLAIAVGNAAKESLATWVMSHGGNADPGRLHDAESSVISPRLRMVGVVHPGAAQDTPVSEITADFRAALRRIERWSTEDPSWLPADPDGVRQSADDYTYKSAPIPFRDFPYGIAWRLGRGATSSNRRDDQTAIQLFSADGSYNNAGDQISYLGSTNGSNAGYVEDRGDLAYEPPRIAYREFDRGPDARFARLLLGGEPDFPWPDFTAMGLFGHPSFGYGPIYRGRLDRPGLLAIADQGSHDDLFTGRALSGDAGQHLQAFLRAAGVTERYAILRVLPVDTLEGNVARMRAAVDDRRTQALYAEVIRRARPGVVLAMGADAQRLVDRLDLGSTSIVSLRAFGQSSWKQSWQTALAALKSLRYGKDLSRPTFSYDGEREQIPRIDLPFGTLRWQGSSGDRAERALESGRPTSNYYKLAMPEWAAELAPAPLSRDEQRAIDELT
jgi:uracil-DNA glycosylase